MDSNLNYRIYYERKLPHYQPEGMSFFITCRLKNSLPRKIIEELRQEYRRVNKELASIVDQVECNRKWYESQKRYFGKWDSLLDHSSEGPTWLANPKVAKIVKDSLHFFDGQRYELDAYCIMPNHIHTVLKPLENAEGIFYSLTSIMHSIKRFTAGEANKLLGRSGPFWQPETFDHIVRDNAELERVIHYVINNPVKAGFVDRWEDWDWTYCRFEM